MSETEEFNSPDAIGFLITLLQAGVGVLIFITYIVTIVFFLMWLYRAYENLPALGAPVHKIEYSSGWAVGSFFVPFVNLVIPYRAVRELWRKSVPDSNTFVRDLSPPVFFPIWWALWLLSNIANNVAFRMSLSDKAIDPMLITISDLIVGLLDILSAILFIMVIKEIDKKQTESSLLSPQESVANQPPQPPGSFSDLRLT